MFKNFLSSKSLFTPALSLCALFATYIIVKQELRDIFGFVSQTIAFALILAIHKIFIISFASTEKSLKNSNWLLLTCNIIATSTQFWLIWNTLRVLTSSSYLRNVMIFLSISLLLAFLQNIFIKNQKFQYFEVSQIFVYGVIALFLHLNLFIGDTRSYTIFLQITSFVVIICEAVSLFFVSQFYLDSRKE